MLPNQDGTLRGKNLGKKSTHVDNFAKFCEPHSRPDRRHFKFVTGFDLVKV